MSDEFNQSGVAGDVITQSAVSDKSKIVAILLSLFLGTLGIHRFYIGRAGSGVLMLLLSIIGWATSAILIGYVFLAIVGLWDIIDFLRLLFNGLSDSQGRKLK